MKDILKNKVPVSKVNKKQHVLIVFLIISSFFWLLTKLSNEYSASVIYNVNYINLPATKLFQNNPNATIELQLKTSGFKLLRERINKKTITLDLQNVLFKEKYHYYILSKTKKVEIQKQLSNHIQLEFVTKDSLFFDLGLNKLKKVPVISDLDIRFKSGYNLSDKITVTPDSIEIRGPEIQVDQVKELKFEILELQEVSENVYYEVKLLLPENLNKINYSSKVVKVIAKVEKFTEGNFEIPFYIEGIPEDSKITTYPKKVKVVFQVGISNYSKISASDFKVKCNYNVSKNNNLNYLTPVLVEKPGLISSVKLVPDHIEFLIQK